MAGMKAVFNCFITFPLTVRLVMGRTKLEHEKKRMKIKNMIDKKLIGCLQYILKVYNYLKGLYKKSPLNPLSTPPDLLLNI